MKMMNAAAAALLAVALAPCAAFAQTADSDAAQGDAAAESGALAVESGSDLDVVAGENAALADFSSAPAAGADESANSVSTLADDEELDEVEAFVTRLYALVLDREPDEAGFAVQVNGVRTSGAGQIAFNFFNSAEFAEKSLSNAERVEIAYQVMLDRASDAEGKAMWVGYLDNGMTIGSVVAGFAESPEFTELCATWGVPSGDVSALRSQLEARDQNPHATAYVSRLYRLVLDRQNPAADELNYQVSALLGGMSASQLAMNFFNADEFAAKGLDPEEQVRLVYLAMLDREPDDEGLAFWVEGFDYQMTVESVVAGFANADEFKANCEEWGVTPGNVNVAHGRNLSQYITRAIYETYEIAFGRTPDLEGLDYWCEVCSEKGFIWVCQGFLQSDEVTSKASTDEDKVAFTYRICLGREGEAEGVEGWTEYLSKYNLYALLARFCESSEFAERCADLKIPAGELLYYAVSTNHELNLLITDIIQNVTGLDAYACYLYVSTFTYHSRALWPSYDGWMEDYAINFIRDGGGNCYGYAATFAFLARACGYDTGVHQGRTTSSSGGTTPHGWCEVYVSGQTLVVDPDLYHELGTHCYMLPYGSTPLALYL